MEHVNCRALVWETYYGESAARQFDDVCFKPLAKATLHYVVKLLQQRTCFKVAWSPAKLPGCH